LSFNIKGFEVGMMTAAEMLAKYRESIPHFHGMAELIAEMKAWPIEDQIEFLYHLFTHSNVALSHQISELQAFCAAISAPREEKDN
jgi:hypothetical protein